MVNVIIGDEPPELLMFWELEYEMCITHNSTMIPIDKLNILK